LFAVVNNPEEKEGLPLDAVRTALEPAGGLPFLSTFANKRYLFRQIFLLIPF